MKILQIAYYYPPMGGAGVQRALKFSKYLPGHGITPIIISCNDQNYTQDETLLNEIPSEVEIHRIKFSSAISWLASLISMRSKTTATSKKIEQREFQKNARLAIREKILIAIRTMQIPDEANFWARKALKHARAVLRDHASRGEPIRVIVSSSPPVSSHWLADRLGREFNIPWIADYRDLWTENPAYSLPKWRRVLDTRTEQQWLNRAAGVITVTPTWQRMLASKISPHIPVKMIPNGYDEADFFDLPKPIRDLNRFTIVHTGTFYGPRGPEALLDGLDHYLKTYHEPPPYPQLRIRLIGNMGTRFSNLLRTFQFRNPGVLEIIPYMPHSQALSEMMAADALLLVVGSGSSEAIRGWLPGKIFEYLRASKPILGIGDPCGDAAGLISRYSRGIIVNNDDPHGLAQAIHRIISEDMNPPTPEIEKIQPYNIFERNALTHQLADFLRDCQSRSPCSTK